MLFDNYATHLYRIPTIDLVTIHSYQERNKPDNILGHNEEDGTKEIELSKTNWQKPIIVEEMGPVAAVQGNVRRRDGSHWVHNAVRKWFELGASGCMQWAFSVTETNTGNGDKDSGMHISSPDNALPRHDWGGLFDAYKSFGDSRWRP